ADLLVEKDVLREAVDLVVHPESDLSEPARARVQTEDRVEELAAARRFCRHHVAVLEAQPDVVDLSPLEERGEAEADLALGLRLDWARVDLAVGHVMVTVCGFPLAALDDETEVGVRPDDPQLARTAQLLRARREIGARRLPVRHR